MQYMCKIGYLKSVIGKRQSPLTHPKWKSLDLAAIDICQANTQRYAPMATKTSDSETTGEPDNDLSILSPLPRMNVQINYGEPKAVTYAKFFQGKDVEVPRNLLVGFRMDANYFYFTGLLDPVAVLLLSFNNRLHFGQNGDMSQLEFNIDNKGTEDRGIHYKDDKPKKRKERFDEPAVFVFQAVHGDPG